MKYSIPILFLCFLSFSQPKDSLYNINTKNIFSVISKLDSLSKLTPTYKFNYNLNDTGLLYVYNRNTNLTDYFNIIGDSIYFVKTVNYKLHQFTQKDSFNPQETNNMVTAVIMGSLLFLNDNILKNAIRVKFKL